MRVALALLVLPAFVSAAHSTEIKGTWRIPGYWSGKFLMIRSPGKVAAVTRKVAERV